MSDGDNEKSELEHAKNMVRKWKSQREDEKRNNPPGVYSARWDFLNDKVEKWSIDVGVWNRRLSECRRRNGLSF